MSRMAGEIGRWRLLICVVGMASSIGLVGCTVDLEQSSPSRETPVGGLSAGSECPGDPIVEAALADALRSRASELPTGLTVGGGSFDSESRNVRLDLCVVDTDPRDSASLTARAIQASPLGDSVSSMVVQVREPNGSARTVTCADFTAHDFSGDPAATRNAWV